MLRMEGGGIVLEQKGGDRRKRVGEDWDELMGIKRFARRRRGKGLGRGYESC